jgi:hypothetical protein
MARWPRWPPSLFGGDVSGLAFEATVVRLAGLAAAKGGTVIAAEAEQDELLARDRATTSAAARMLASGTDVVATPLRKSGRWFPYAQLSFTRMLDADTAAHDRGTLRAPRGLAQRPTPQVCSACYRPRARVVRVVAGLPVYYVSRVGLRGAVNRNRREPGDDDQAR